MGNYYKFISILLTLSISSYTFGQTGKSNINDSTYLDAKNYINTYYDKQELIAQDSLFLLNLDFLDWYTMNDTLIQQYKAIRNIIEQNRPSFHIEIIKKHYDSLLIKKHLYDSLRKDYVQFEMLQEQIDSSHISSSDSNFMDLIDKVITQPAELDSIQKKDSIVLELHEKYYQNDTLLTAINNIIQYNSNNEFLDWVQLMRRDTFNFYIINNEGDSLRIPLYDANLNLVRFNLTDYWGSAVQAIIRDISSNSFKLLVDDDAPTLDYETSEKAIKAFEQLHKKKKTNQLMLTIEKRELPPDLKKWQIYGNVHADFSQVGMHQWAQGGEPTISFQAGSELFTKYKKQNQHWENYLRMDYGVIRQGRYEDKSEKYRPNVDRIEFNTKYGYKILAHTSLSMEGDFKSQFSDQHEWDGNEKQEKLSGFMSPGYTTLSIGLDYSKFKDLELFVSPASSRTTFVLDTSVTIKQRYGVDSTLSSRNEFGFRLHAKHKFKIWSNIEIQNILTLYSNYLYKPKNVDVNWELNIVFPVNDYLNASFGANLIYDDDQLVPKYLWGTDDDGVEGWIRHEGKGLQIKEMLKLGLIFKF